MHGYMTGVSLFVSGQRACRSFIHFIENPNSDCRAAATRLIPPSAVRIDPQHCWFAVKEKSVAHRRLMLDLSRIHDSIRDERFRCRHRVAGLDCSLLVSLLSSLIHGLQHVEIGSQASRVVDARALILLVLRVLSHHGRTGKSQRHHRALKKKP
jgi:hypothetical protein